jgi:CRP-like cAMP-binding protein
MADEVAYEPHPAGTTIVRKGDPGDKFYVIKSGTIKIVDREKLGAEQEPHLKSGEFFGEVALMTGEPRNATVIAETDAELYSLGKAEFAAVLKGSETFEEEFRKVVFERQ